MRACRNEATSSSSRWLFHWNWLGVSRYTQHSSLQKCTGHAHHYTHMHARTHTHTHTRTHTHTHTHNTTQHTYTDRHELTTVCCQSSSHQGIITNQQQMANSYQKCICLCWVSCISVNCGFLYRITCSLLRMMIYMYRWRRGLQKTKKINGIKK